MLRDLSLYSNFIIKKILLLFWQSHESMNESMKHIVIVIETCVSVRHSALGYKLKVWSISENSSDTGKRKIN